MMMMIAPNSLARQKEGILLFRGRSRKSNKVRSNRNSDVRCGRSHRSILVRGVGWEEQEKTWMVVWGSNPEEG